jgi:hypothetical protein
MQDDGGCPELRYQDLPFTGRMLRVVAAADLRDDETMKAVESYRQRK